MNEQISCYAFIPRDLPHPFCTEARKRKKAPKDEENGKPSDVKPSLIRGPYLQCATPTQYIGSLAYRRILQEPGPFRHCEGWLTGMADDSALVTEHQVPLRGLEPDTRYYYSIGDLRDTLQIRS